MGYVDRDNVELDAILTKKGRELLTNDPGKFSITKFSLFDDEIDYRLWNTSHSLGTSYYGELIENTPVIEPLPGEEQQAKFNLITMPKETVNLPQLFLGATEVELKAGQEYIITPQSIPNTYNLTQGYFATVWDFDFGLVVLTDDYLPGDDSITATTLNVPINIFGSSSHEGPNTMTTRGFTFKLIAKEFEDNLDHIYRVTVRGNETGERETMVVTVKGKYVSQPRA